MSSRGSCSVHKKTREFGSNERREREKSLCVGDRKTGREKESEIAEIDRWGKRERGAIQAPAPA